MAFSELWHIPRLECGLLLLGQVSLGYLCSPNLVLFLPGDVFEILVGVSEHIFLCLLNLSSLKIMGFPVLCCLRLDGLKLFLTDLSLVFELIFVILVAQIWGWGPVVGRRLVLGQ